MTEVLDQGVAELLDRSAERDLYTARIGQAYRQGWEAGHVAGVGDGRQAEGTERDRRWNDIARPVARGAPEHAELELRRWGPGGREHFGDPRPGDYPGGPVTAW